MAAEVDEVERAECAGDLDDGHLAWAADEDGDVIDLAVDEVEPEVCEGLLWGGVLFGRGVLVDQVLPSGGVEGGDQSRHVFRDVEGRLMVAEVFNGDGVELADRAFAAVKIAVGSLEHIVVEGEGGVGCVLGGEVFELVGEASGLLRVGCEGQGEERADGQSLHVRSRPGWEGKSCGAYLWAKAQNFS